LIIFGVYSLRIIGSDYWSVLISVCLEIASSRPLLAMTASEGLLILRWQKLN